MLNLEAIQSIQPTLAKLAQLIAQRDANVATLAELNASQTELTNEIANLQKEVRETLGEEILGAPPESPNPIVAARTRKPKNAALTGQILAVFAADPTVQRSIGQVVKALQEGPGGAADGYDPGEFRQLVSQRLTSLKDDLERVSTGVYRLKFAFATTPVPIVNTPAMEEEIEAENQ